MNTPNQNQAKYHAWRINQREYYRHYQRRGKVHAYQTIDPQRTALVVVDMIAFFVEENPYCRGILPNINTLAETVRDAGGSVAWILPAVKREVSAKEIEARGSKVAAMYNEAGGSGAFEDRLWHELKTSPDDLMVEKRAASAFFPGRSPLPQLLEERQINTVLITGTVTNVCCEASARDANTLGYRVIMVADANAGTNDASHNATLRTIYRSVGDVRPTNEVIELIKAGVD